MDLYGHTDYKAAIRARVKELQQTKKRALTLKRLASQIPVQYTYLSKILNDRKAHLSEDHLFSVSRILELPPEESDYLHLLRAYEVALDPKRKEALLSKIEDKRRERKLNAEVVSYSASNYALMMDYLCDPICTVVNISLHVDAIRKNPRALAPKLGISEQRLKQILKLLDQLEFIELAEDGFTVRKFLKSQMHFGRDHPLTRVHQNLLKTVLQSQLMRTPERDKHSVAVTFTSDEQGFARIKEEFDAFLKRVEGIVAKTGDTTTLQLSFDLFRWF